MPVLLVAALAPAWVWLRTQPVMDLLPRGLELGLGRGVLVLVLGVWAGEAWRAAGPRLFAALAGRRAAFTGLAGLLLTAHLAFSGAFSRGTGSLRLLEGYGPLVPWPLLQVPLPGLVLQAGLGQMLVGGLLALLLASALLIARDQGALRRCAPGAPGLLLLAPCPACLPPLVTLLGMAGLATPMAVLGDPGLPASALVLLAGPALGLVALMVVLPRANTLMATNSPPAPASPSPDGTLQRTGGGADGPPGSPAPHPAAFPAPRPASLLALAPVLAFAGMPRGGSPQQDLIGDVYLAALIGAGLMVAVVFAWLLANVVRYRDRGREPEGKEAGRGARRAMLAAFLLVPALIVYGIGLFSHAALQEIEAPPENALHVDVVAGQFAWEFHYPDGSVTHHELFVPEGRPVHVNVTTKDVIHSFFIPEMGVKADAVPNMVHEASFHPARTGSFQGYCAEHCGAGHSEMLFTLTVFPEGFEPPYEEA